MCRNGCPGLFCSEDFCHVLQSLVEQFAGAGQVDAQIALAGLLPVERAAAHKHLALVEQSFGSLVACQSESRNVHPSQIGAFEANRP